MNGREGFQAKLFQSRPYSFFLCLFLFIWASTDFDLKPISWTEQSFGGTLVHVSEQGLLPFPPPLLLQGNRQQHHTDTLPPVTPQQWSVQAKNSKQWDYYVRKETAKMPMVYSLWRWLILQHSTILFQNNYSKIKILTQRRDEARSLDLCWAQASIKLTFVCVCVWLLQRSHCHLTKKHNCPFALNPSMEN